MISHSGANSARSFKNAPVSQAKAAKRKAHDKQERLVNGSKLSSIEDLHHDEEENEENKSLMINMMRGQPKESQPI
jgi:hypothetical protein